MKLKTRDGILTEKPDGQSRFLKGLYGSLLGRMLLKPLVTPGVSRAAGKLLSTKASCVLIKPFVRSTGIDMSQYVPQTYTSYNDFFIRRIRPELRPVEMNPRILISPCDSKLTVLPITPESRFTLKHTEYTLESMLRDPELAGRYQGGYCLIFRLAVDDYHRFCYAADGEKGENVKISGVFHTVNPIANDYFPIYKENAREYTVLKNDVFGDILTMEVGALMVGKIHNHHGPAIVKRGQEKGYFLFGGSTVVMLLQAGKAEIDGDILRNSAEGIETIVKFGEKIGQAK